MNLSKFPVYMQAAILALVLAVVGYLVAQALQFSLKAEVIFAAGLAIGGFVVPLFLKRTRLMSPSRSPIRRLAPYM